MFGWSKRSPVYKHNEGLNSNDWLSNSCCTVPQILHFMHHHVDLIMSWQLWFHLYHSSIITFLQMLVFTIINTAVLEMHEWDVGKHGWKFSREVDREKYQLSARYKKTIIYINCLILNYLYCDLEYTQFYYSRFTLVFTICSMFFGGVLSCQLDFAYSKKLSQWGKQSIAL